MYGTNATGQVTFERFLLARGFVRYAMRCVAQNMDFFSTSPTAKRSRSEKFACDVLMVDSFIHNKAPFNTSELPDASMNGPGHLTNDTRTFELLWKHPIGLCKD
jgi:hypothetical protein